MLKQLGADAALRRVHGGETKVQQGNFGSGAEEQCRETWRDAGKSRPAGCRHNKVFSTAGEMSDTLEFTGHLSTDVRNVPFISFHVV